MLLSIAGLFVLLYRSLWQDSVAYTIGAGVYGVSMISVYTSSTLYHVTAARRLKNIFLWLDHSCVYALIAGTYTPFMLSVLRGTVGTAVLCAVWGLAVLGIVSKTVLKLRSDLISLPFYLLMGWMIVLVIRPFASGIGMDGLVLLMAGGLCYSLGIIFFCSKFSYAHAVWHMLVLTGSALHYAGVLLYATPASAS